MNVILFTVVTVLVLTVYSINSVYAVPTNQTNSTQFPILNSTITNSTNSTTLSTPILNSTITNSTNSTTSLPNKTSTMVPMPTPSWQFTSSSTTQNNVNSDSSTEKKSLKLSGEDYLTQKVNSTRNLSSLTLSVWVKPDYSAGSPQFTILSEENSFILAINNNLPPLKEASFSIFDGIKWNTVFCNATIPEDWTHLVATFDSSSINIYLNGTQESTLKLPGVTTIALNGTLTTKTTDNLSSNANVVIGAYMNSIRNTVNNKFSGNIENVTLYDSPLTPEQISQLH